MAEVARHMFQESPFVSVDGGGGHGTPKSLLIPSSQARLVFQDSQPGPFPTERFCDPNRMRWLDFPELLHEVC